MDRIWQWAWDRYGPRYSRAIYGIVFLVLLPIYLVLSFGIVIVEKSGHYFEAGAVAILAVLVMVYLMILPGLGGIRLVEHWARGHNVDRLTALEAAYTWNRAAIVQAVKLKPLRTPSPVSTLCSKS
jgi:adenylate cyclase